MGWAEKFRLVHRSVVYILTDIHLIKALILQKLQVAIPDTYCLTA